MGRGWCEGSRLAAVYVGSPNALVGRAQGGGSATGGVGGGGHTPAIQAKLGVAKQLPVHTALLEHHVVLGKRARLVRQHELNLEQARGSGLGAETGE